MPADYLSVCLGNTIVLNFGFSGTMSGLALRQDWRYVIYQIKVYISLHFCTVYLLNLRVCVCV